MKKIACFVMLLCLLLVFDWAAAPVAAAEPPSDGAEETVPTLELGDVAIQNGCRTLNGRFPLAGSDRLFESAQAAFIYELSTETLIYAYNPDIRLQPGSLSKILTALIALEEGSLNDKVTVSTREISHLPVGSITVDLKNGEVVTLKDLLYCLIVSSANDAALVIAEHIRGDELSFVKMMNEKVKELGCTDTYLTNCHGLEDSDQYTTARDIAKITKAAYENETFREIFGCVEYEIPATNKVDKPRELEPSNHLMYDRYVPQFNDQRVTGAMPSYVSPEIGASISFTAEDDGMSLLVVLMGCKRTYRENGWQVEYYGNFDESLDAMEYTFDGYRIHRVLYSGQALKTFQVNNGENNIVGTPQVEFDTVLPASVKMGNLNDKYSLVSGGLNAPVRAGDKIATVQLWYGSSCLTEAELFAMSGVKSVSDTGMKLTDASRDDSDLSGILGFLGVLCLIILVPIGGYLVYNSIMRSRLRAKRRRRRASRRRSR